MRKYVIFSAVFIVAFVIIQIVTGLLLTIAYTPSLETSLTSEQEIIVGGHVPIMIIALFSAIIAYFTTEKIFNRQVGQKN